MLIRRLTDAVFPRRCPICDRPMEPGWMLCQECAVGIRPIEKDTCRKCGKVLSDTDRLYCYDCSRKIHYYERGFAVFEYSDIKASLYRFKYSGRAEYARFYAFAADRYIGNELRKLGLDAIIPIPIHRRRYAKRGYNQAYELAGMLSQRIGVPVNDRIVRRCRNTVPLKRLSEEERKNNLKNAFIIASNDVKLKKILLVDDIYTTGATIDAVSLLLKNAGVQEIYFLTVAIGAGL